MSTNTGTTPEGEAITPDDTATTTGRRTVAAHERIREVVAELAADLIFDGEAAYAIVTERGHVRTLPIGSHAFRRWVRARMLERGFGQPSAEAFRTAEGGLEAIAAEAGSRSSAPTIRSAGKDGTIWIDLGDDSWRCVKVTRDGWEIVPHPADGPYLYRPPRMIALPEPVTGGSISELWEFVNITDETDRLLFLAWLVYANWPRGPYPLISLHGPQGSAKTVVMSVAKALTDPTKSAREVPAPTSPRSPPKEERDITAYARNARVLAYDNVSYLDQWLSDTLCRIATGAEIGGRELYTDWDEAVFTASRPVMLNGIPDVVGQSDLADRTIKIEVQRPERRIAEAVLYKRFEKAWPRLFGALLDTLVGVLANYGEAGQHISEDVRIQDYARVGEALRLLPPGDFTRAYQANAQNAAAEIGEMDILFAPISGILALGPITTTPSDLLAALNDRAPSPRPKAWPQTPVKLAAHLKRIAPSYRQAGIEIVGPRKSHGKRVYDLALLPTLFTDPPGASQ